MQKEGVRARIHFSGFHNGELEALIAEVKSLGLDYHLHTKTTILVSASREHWESIGIPLEQYQNGNQVYYMPKSEAHPEPLRKFGVKVAFITPAISPRGL